MHNVSPFGLSDDGNNCPSCGFALIESHSKCLCNRCGYNKGCCELV